MNIAAVAKPTAAAELAIDAQQVVRKCGILVKTSVRPMNLATEYLGLQLRSPFVIGASPFCDDVSVARRLEDAGASAVVMRSLFEEQLDAAHARKSAVSHLASEELSRFPEYSDYQLSPDRYLRQIESLKSTLSIPVIASLNGHRPGDWTDVARRIESAGANAIELNFYQVVADPTIAADQVETEMLAIIGLVAEAVKIPVAVKLSPFHSSIAQLAVALELAGARGVVIFNRFYQPDVNTETIEVQPMLRLSEPQELLLRLRWLAILSPELRCSLAATGGIHSADAVVKTILAGADIVQIVSVVLRHGVAIIPTLAAGLQSWMRDHGFSELREFRGALDHRRCRDASAYERANYIRMLQSWKV